VSQAAIAAISGLIPTMFMTRVRLYARTERAISAATFGRVLVRKCVAPYGPSSCRTDVRLSLDADAWLLGLHQAAVAQPRADAHAPIV
jgi:hypothetical protein